MSNFFRIKLHCSVLCILFFSNICTSIAQDYIAKVKLFSVEDGLSGRYVHNIQVDHNGSVWISTWLGLNKFDGYEFVSYPQKEYGFQSNTYEGIHLGPHKNIWLIRYQYMPEAKQDNPLQMIDIFNPITEEIDNSALSVFPFDIQEIKQIKGDRFYNIWIGLNNGTIYKYNKQGLFKILEASIFRSFALTSDSDIAVLLPDRKTIELYNKEQRKIKTERLEHFVVDIVADTNNGLVVQTMDVLDNNNFLLEHFYLHATKKFEEITFLHNNEEFEIINKGTTKVPININSLGKLWIYTNGKLLVFDSNYELTFESPMHKLINFAFHTPEQVWCISSDGISGISLRKNLFTNFLGDTSFVDTRGITEDNHGNIYVNQINTYQYTPQTKTTKMLGYYGGRDLLFIDEYTLLVSNYTHPLLRYDLRSLNEKPFDFESLDWIDYGTLLLMHKSRKTGKIYFSTQTLGLFNFDIDTEQVSLFREVNQFDQFYKNEIYFFHENSDGIWLGTKVGLFLLDEEQGIIRHENPTNESGKAISCLSIHEDEDGYFWIGTYNQGLFRWNKERDEIRHFTTADGLSDNMIYGIYEDDYQSLWMSTNQGINKMHRKTFETAIFQPVDGLPHEEFNMFSHHKSKDGTLYFGGLGGVTSFHPEKFYSRSEEVTTSVSSVSKIEVFEEESREWKKQKLSTSGDYKIRLSNANTRARISMSAIDKINKERNQYAYRLGENVDWTYADDNILTIEDVPIETSQLEIKSRMKNSGWNAQTINIEITRTQAFYLSRWFLTIAAFVVFLLTILSVNQSIKRRKHIEQLEAQVKKSDTDHSEKSSYSQTMMTADQKWLHELEINARNLIDEGKFSIQDMANSMDLSERQFRRKFKLLTKTTPIDYMRNLRLIKARQLLISNSYKTVAEVSVAVGFFTPKHFSKLFREKFGKKPSFFLRVKEPKNRVI